MFTPKNTQTMKKGMFILLALIATSVVFGQKVKEKDNIYYIDNVPYMQGDFDYGKKENYATEFTSPDKKVTYFTMKLLKRVSAAYTAPGASPIIIKYVKLELNGGSSFVFSKHSINQIVKEIYLCKCLQADGTIDKAKLLSSSKTFSVDPREY